MKRDQSRNPGRPREFDLEEVLEKATSVFWSRGFANTTYHDLEEATGLHGQSLRYAFGDKRSFFLTALRHYSATRVRRIVDMLTCHDHPPLTRVKGALGLWLGDVRRDADSGCFIVNTIGELGRTDDEVAQIVKDADEVLVGAFGVAFAAAQETGELGPGSNPDELARMIVTLGDGVMLHSRAKGSAETAEMAFSSFWRLLRG